MKASLWAALAVLASLVNYSQVLSEEAKPLNGGAAIASKKLEPHEVRSTVSLVLARESAAKTPQERAAAVRDLSTLYLALARDTEMARAPRLKLKAKMYSRLIAAKQELQRDLARRKEAGDYPLELPDVGDDQQSQAVEVAEARGGGAVRDYGEVLVELIQHTISPEHWDVNGGPGSIVYWPNLQVLVVRASGDAHGHVGGLFDGLRAAK